jgi:hypothetical protein
MVSALENVQTPFRRPLRSRKTVAELQIERLRTFATALEQVSALVGEEILLAQEMLLIVTRLS